MVIIDSDHFFCVPPTSLHSSARASARVYAVFGVYGKPIPCSGELRSNLYVALETYRIYRTPHSLLHKNPLEHHNGNGNDCTIEDDDVVCNVRAFSYMAEGGKFTNSITLPHCAHAATAIVLIKMHSTSNIHTHGEHIAHCKCIYTQ